MQQLVLKITRETWEKCGITILKHYNEKENIIELWQKMNDVKRKTGYLNIADIGIIITEILVFLLLKSLHVI